MGATGTPHFTFCLNTDVRGCGCLDTPIGGSVDPEGIFRDWLPAKTRESGVGVKINNNHNDDHNNSNNETWVFAVLDPIFCRCVIFLPNIWGR